MELTTRALAKTIREARGCMAQTEAAKRLGLTQPTLCKLENGLRVPTAVELWNLAQLYKKPLSSFFTTAKKTPAFLTEELVVFSVNYHGYDSLILRKNLDESTPLSVEETIMAILLYYSEPRLLEAIPVLFYLNDIDFESLYEQAKYYDIQNRLGFVADVTAECFKKRKIKKNFKGLRDLCERLEKIKLAREDSFQEKAGRLSGRMIAYLRQSREEPAAKWNILDRLFLSGFQEVFEHAILAKNR